MRSRLALAVNTLVSGMKAADRKMGFGQPDRVRLALSETTAAGRGEAGSAEIGCLLQLHTRLLT